MYVEPVETRSHRSDGSGPSVAASAATSSRRAAAVSETGVGARGAVAADFVGCKRLPDSAFVLRSSHVGSMSTAFRRV